MQKSVLALLISVVVSAGLVGEWYLRNRGYPVFDAAKYFIDCLEHYSRYRDSGWTSFLSQLFRTGDPPLFMNALGGIALVATGGSVLASIGLCMTALYLVFVVYGFLHFLRVLSPFRACLASIFLSSLPWVLRWSVIFEPYVGFLGFGLGASYHLIQSRNFRYLRHSVAFGLCLALAFSFRPFEAILLFSPAILQSTLLGMDEGTVSRGEFFGSVFISVLAGGLSVFFWHQGFYPKGVTELFLAALLGGAGIFAIQDKSRRSIPFLAGFVLFFFWFLVWFLPSSAKFYSWAFRWTFDPSLKQESVYVKESAARFLEDMARVLGGYPFLAVTGIALLRGNGSLAFRKRDRSFWRRPEVAFVCGAVFLGFLGVYTRRFQDCYFLPCFTTLGLILVGAALSNKPNFPRLRTALFLALAAFQLLYGWSAVFPDLERRLPDIDWGQLQPVVDHDLERELVEKLARTIDPAMAARIQLLIQNRGPKQPEIDSPPGLLLQAKILYPRWQIFWGVTPSALSDDDRLVDLSHKMDFAVVGPVIGTPNLYDIVSSTLPSAAIRAWQENRLDRIGFTLAEKIHLATLSGRSADYLLIKSVRTSN